MLGFPQYHEYIAGIKRTVFTCFFEEVDSFFARKDVSEARVVLPLWRTIFPIEHSFVFSSFYSDSSKVHGSEKESIVSGSETHFRWSIPGRLSSQPAGAGKLRIFAIGNYFALVLLRPYHDWCMKLLSCLVNDGTYDQSGPLRWVKGKSL